MQVVIEAECRRGLKIIGEIPSTPLCKIEGYNGVGKTSAIKLLQLCTGMQPFNDVTWRTFCSELIYARVVARQLNEAREIEWILEPNHWEEGARSQAKPLSEDMVRVAIDGRRKKLRDAASLLQVHHLNIAETPETILASRAHIGGHILSAWHSADERADAVDAPLFRLAKLLESCSTDRARLALKSADRAETVVREISQRARGARERVDLLTTAVATADRLDALRGATPRHQDRLSQLESELATVDMRKNALDEEIEAAYARQDSDKRAENAFGRAQKALERCTRSQHAAAEELRETAAQVGVSPARDSIQRELALIEQRLTQLQDALPHVSAGPMLATLLEDLVSRLELAIAADLGDKILFDQEAPTWTVHSLHNACKQQLEKFSERRPTSDEQQLNENIEQARLRLGALNDVLQKLAASEDAEGKLRDAEAKLVKAVSGLPGKGGRSLDEMTKERNTCVQQGRSLQSSIDRLRSELALIGGGHTEEELMQELDRLCREAEVTQSRLRNELKKSEDHLTQLNKEETQASVELASTSRDARKYLDGVHRVVAEVATAGSYDWLGRVLPNFARLQELPMEEQMKLLDELLSHVKSARGIIDETKRAIETLSAQLKGLAERIEHPERVPANNVYDPSLAAAWLAEEARAWLDDESMKEALFGGGDDVRFDPRNLTLSWSLGGERVTRPLAGFSSGEQAFAYTRAQLLQLERDSASTPNRLIALDEFGAYLDGRRIADLVEDLRKRKNRAPDDQVVLILPTSLNAPPSPNAIGTDRRAMLARHGYYAESL
ncbi:hypothetical protein ABGB14_09350 [Nonomuraea sp. B10E15]|uniref:hypothetical protein n=1 Tax=Nonomuraea sp. B10E15 TaxID=3153560 RepID=UPI00325F4335